MSTIEITSMSTKGQVVIPASMRKKLKIGSGSKMIVVQEGNNILLKPIESSGQDEFKEIIQLAENLTNELDLSEADVDKTIKAVRSKHANRT